MQKKRVRDVLIKFYVLPEERELIELKMKMTKYKSMSAYLRQAACYNKVIVKQYDFGDFKQMNKDSSCSHRLLPIHRMSRIFQDLRSFLR